MNSASSLERLYGYAAAYKFSHFTAAFMQDVPSLPDRDRTDAYLMRAQIKLFSTDASLADDLTTAEQCGGLPQHPCLVGRWLPDGNNRFFVFSENPDVLRGFLKLLPQATDVLGRMYGDVGANMAYQVQGEILYYFGEYEKALAAADAQRFDTGAHQADSIISGYLKFRCHLAMGNVEQAEQCMIDMVRTAQFHPEALGPYQAVREWANLTTGWSGDNSRFLDLEDANPVLEDRLDAIRKGVSRLSPLEEPFAKYARHNYQGAYTMRQHYMDVFNALYWFQQNDYRQALTHFLQGYRVSFNTGIVMSFAEYGRQMLPLLHYARQHVPDCSPDWIARIALMAERYEEGLDAYRN